jgi:hypothetical protein
LNIGDLDDGSAAAAAATALDARITAIADARNGGMSCGLHGELQGTVINGS